jgi:hypothetical protein
MSDPNSTPPGWYNDQSAQPVLRYWDGQAWTDQTRPLGSEPVPEPTSDQSFLNTATVNAAAAVVVDEAHKRKSRKRAWIVLGSVGGVIVAIAIISSIASSPSFQSGYNAALTEDTTSASSDTPAAPAPKDTSVGVPNMVGMTVADAKTAAQAAGLTLSFADGTGDDWTVSAQTPDANSRVDPGTPVTVQGQAPKPKLTVGQEQAVAKAQSYLSVLPFSRQGLIDQLVFDQFPVADATFAADNIGADWNAQAVLKAKSYLSAMSFSHGGLVDQLVFDKFTREQAEYGVSQNGL